MLSNLYFPGYDYPRLRDALAAAMNDGDPTQMFQILDDRISRGPDGRYLDNSTEAFYAVTCLDRPYEGSVEDVRALAEEWKATAPTFGPALAWGLLPCKDWPASAETITETVAAGSNPILVVSTRKDPATPYQWGELVARAARERSPGDLRGRGSHRLRRRQRVRRRCGGRLPAQGNAAEAGPRVPMTRWRCWRMLVPMAATAAVLVAGNPTPAGAAPPELPRGAVAVIGDFGSGLEAERSVADLVRRARPVAVVTAGDNVYDDRGYPTLVGDYYGRWVAAGNVLPAVGNHDHDVGIRAFDEYFSYLDGRHVYSAGRGGMRFFVLDSTTALGSATSMARQRAWLKRSLQASRARWKVVVLHHPPYSSGAHGSSPELRWPYAAWGADLVVSGHDHDYERVSADRTTFVVDGAGGKELYDFNEPVPGSRVRYNAGYGALFLTATARTLTGEFWSAGGDRVDRFVLTP